MGLLAQHLWYWTLRYFLTASPRDQTESEVALMSRLQTHQHILVTHSVHEDHWWDWTSYWHACILYILWPKLFTCVRFHLFSQTKTDLLNKAALPVLFNSVNEGFLLIRCNISAGFQGHSYLQYQRCKRIFSVNAEFQTTSQQKKGSCVSTAA